MHRQHHRQHHALVPSRALHSLPSAVIQPSPQHTRPSRPLSSIPLSITRSTQDQSQLARSSCTATARSSFHTVPSATHHRARKPVQAIRFQQEPQPLPTDSQSVWYNSTTSPCLHGQGRISPVAGMHMVPFRQSSTYTQPNKGQRHREAASNPSSRPRPVGRQKPPQSPNNTGRKLGAYTAPEWSGVDIDALDSLESPNQLISLYRSLNDSQNTTDMEKIVAMIAASATKFTTIPAVVYAMGIQAFLNNGNLIAAYHYTMHSLRSGTMLSSQIYTNVVQHLALRIHVEEVKNIIRLALDLSERGGVGSPTTTTTTSSLAKNPQTTTDTPQGGGFESEDGTMHASIPSIDATAKSLLYNSLVTVLAKANEPNEALTVISTHFTSGSGHIISGDTVEEVCRALFKRHDYQKAEDLVREFHPFINESKLSRLYSQLATAYLNQNVTAKVNRILYTMEQLSIPPSSIMLNSLLYHIIRYRGPLQALKWYRTIYGTRPLENGIPTDLNSGASALSPSPSGQGDDKPYPSPLRKQGGNGGKQQNLRIANIVLEGLLESNLVTEALNFLVTLPCHVSSVNILIKYFLDRKDYDSIRLTFKYMSLRDLQLDTTALGLLIQTLGSSTDPQTLRALLTSLYDQGITPTVRIYTMIITSFCEQGFPEYGEAVIDEMRSNKQYPNVIAYTSIMRAYVAKGRVVEALRLKNTMERRGIKPTMVTYQILLDGANRRGETMLLFMTLLDMFHSMDHLVPTMDINYNIIRLLRDQWKLDPANVTLHQRFLIASQNYIRICCQGLNKVGENAIAMKLLMFFKSIGGNDLASESPTAGVYRRYPSFDRYQHYLDRAFVGQYDGLSEHDELPVANNGYGNHDDDTIPPSPHAPHQDRGLSKRNGAHQQSKFKQQQQQQQQQYQSTADDKVPALSDGQLELLDSLRTFAMSSLQGLIDSTPPRPLDTRDAHRHVEDDTRQPSYEPVTISESKRRNLNYSIDPFLNGSAISDPQSYRKLRSGVDHNSIDHALMGIQMKQKNKFTTQNAYQTEYAGNRM